MEGWSLSMTTVRSTSPSSPDRSPRTVTSSITDLRIGDVVALLWGVSEVHDTIAEVYGEKGNRQSSGALFSETSCEGRGHVGQHR